MLDPVSFNQLGKIRQQEILAEAEHYRDSMTFGEMGRALLSLVANGWHKLRHLGGSSEPCPEPETSPGMTTEIC